MYRWNAVDFVYGRIMRFKLLHGSFCGCVLLPFHARWYSVMAEQIFELKEKKMRNTFTRLLSIGTLAASISFAGVALAGEKKAESPYTPKAGQCVAVMQVKGMTCGGGCPPRVLKVLKAVKGVDKVRVNFETKRADVLAESQACAKAALEKFPKALKEAGFDGEVTEVIKGDKAS